MADLFTLPQLKFDYDALEPFIDAQTMELHHSKHHAGYTSKLNAALEDVEGVQGKSIEEILKNIDVLPEKIRQTVINNGGGYYNHKLFWTMLSPEKTDMSDELTSAIKKNFGSVDEFSIEFSDMAMGVFGSGWVWLCKDEDDSLQIEQSANQNNPIMDSEMKLLLGLDVWEHAYYLKYQNRRDEYIENWWNVVNWQEVSTRFSA